MLGPGEALPVASDSSGANDAARGGDGALNPQRASPEQRAHEAHEAHNSQRDKQIRTKSRTLRSQGRARTALFVFAGAVVVALYVVTKLVRVQTLGAMLLIEGLGIACVTLTLASLVFGNLYWPATRSVLGSPYLWLACTIAALDSLRFVIELGIVPGLTIFEAADQCGATLLPRRVYDEQREERGASIRDGVFPIPETPSYVFTWYAFVSLVTGVFLLDMQIVPFRRMAIPIFSFFLLALGGRYLDAFFRGGSHPMLCIVNGFFISSGGWNRNMAMQGALIIARALHGMLTDPSSKLAIFILQPLPVSNRANNVPWPAAPAPTPRGPAFASPPSSPEADCPVASLTVVDVSNGAAGEGGGDGSPTRSRRLRFSPPRHRRHRARRDRPSPSSPASQSGASGDDGRASSGSAGVDGHAGGTPGPQSSPSSAGAATPQSPTRGATRSSRGLQRAVSRIFPSTGPDHQVRDRGLFAVTLESTDVRRTVIANIKMAPNNPASGIVATFSNANAEGAYVYPSGSESGGTGADTDATATTSASHRHTSSRETSRDLNSRTSKGSDRINGSGSSQWVPASRFAHCFPGAPLARCFRHAPAPPRAGQGDLLHQPRQDQADALEEEEDGTAAAAGSEGAPPPQRRHRRRRRGRRRRRRRKRSESHTPEREDPARSPGPGTPHLAPKAHAALRGKVSLAKVLVSDAEYERICRLRSMAADPRQRLEAADQGEVGAAAPPMPDSTANADLGLSDSESTTDGRASDRQDTEESGGESSKEQSSGLTSGAASRAGARRQLPLVQLTRSGSSQEGGGGSILTRRGGGAWRGPGEHEVSGSGSGSGPGVAHRGTSSLQSDQAQAGGALSRGNPPHRSATGRGARVGSHSIASQPDSLDPPRECARPHGTIGADHVPAVVEEEAEVEAQHLNPPGSGDEGGVPPPAGAEGMELMLPPPVRRSSFRGGGSEPRAEGGGTQSGAGLSVSPHGSSQCEGDGPRPFHPSTGSDAQDAPAHDHDRTRSACFPRGPVQRWTGAHAAAPQARTRSDARIGASGLHHGLGHAESNGPRLLADEAGDQDSTEQAAEGGRSIPEDLPGAPLRQGAQKAPTLLLLRVNTPAGESAPKGAHAEEVPAEAEGLEDDSAVRAPDREEGQANRRARRWMTRPGVWSRGRELEAAEEEDEVKDSSLEPRRSDDERRPTLRRSFSGMTSRLTVSGARGISSLRAGLESDRRGRAQRLSTVHGVDLAGYARQQAKRARRWRAVPFLALGGVVSYLISEFLPRGPLRGALGWLVPISAACVFLVVLSLQDWDRFHYTSVYTNINVIVIFTTATTIVILGVLWPLNLISTAMAIGFFCAVMSTLLLDSTRPLPPIYLRISFASSGLILCAFNAFISYRRPSPVVFAHAYGEVTADDIRRSAYFTIFNAAFRSAIIALADRDSTHAVHASRRMPREAVAAEAEFRRESKFHRERERRDRLNHQLQELRAQERGSPAAALSRSNSRSNSRTITGILGTVSYRSLAQRLGPARMQGPASRTRTVSRSRFTTLLSPQRARNGGIRTRTTSEGDAAAPDTAGGDAAGGPGQGQPPGSSDGEEQRSSSSTDAPGVAASSGGCDAAEDTDSSHETQESGVRPICGISSAVAGGGAYGPGDGRATVGPPTRMRARERRYDPGPAARPPNVELRVASRGTLSESDENGTHGNTPSSDPTALADSSSSVDVDSDVQEL